MTQSTFAYAETKESHYSDDELIKLLNESGKETIIINDIEISKVENIDKVLIIDGIEEPVLKKDAYMIDRIVDEKNNHKVSCVVDLETKAMTNSSGSQSNSETSNGRIRITSSIWYNKLNGTGVAATFIGVQPYKVGGEINSMPNSTTLNSVTGKLEMNGPALVYPTTNNTSGPYSQTLNFTFANTMSLHTSSFSLNPNTYYYIAGTGMATVKFTYKVAYSQYGNSGTASVTVFVSEN